MRIFLSIVDCISCFQVSVGLYFSTVLKFNGLSILNFKDGISFKGGRL